MDEKNNPENWQTDSRLKSFDINLPYNRFHFEWNITPPKFNDLFQQIPDANFVS